MADGATSRVRVIGKLRPTAGGKRGSKIHKSLGWDIVQVEGRNMFEPVDYVPVNYSSASDKEVTGYMFVGDGTHFTGGLDGVGGQVAGPENQG